MQTWYMYQITYLCLLSNYKYYDLTLFHRAIDLCILYGIKFIEIFIIFK